MKSTTNRSRSAVPSSTAKLANSIRRDSRILDQSFTLLRHLAILIVFIAVSCGKTDQSKRLPDIAFDQNKWMEKQEAQYKYRKQMINDLLKNYQWAGLSKDSAIQLLGEPDAFEEGNLMYDYERKPILGGMGTQVEALVLELSPDGTIKQARLNDGGWD